MVHRRGMILRFSDDASALDCLRPTGQLRAMIHSRAWGNYHGMRKCAILAGFALLACDEPPQDRGHRCERLASSALGLQQQLVTGTTGQELIKLAAGTHPLSLKLRPISPSMPKCTISPIPDQSSATLTIEPVPGEGLTYVTSTYIPCREGASCPEARPRCYNTFYVPVTARLTAHDGSINEVWEGELEGVDLADARAPSAGVTEKRTAWLSFFRARNTFTNRFQISAPQFDRPVDLLGDDLVLNASFFEQELAGGNVQLKLSTISRAWTSEDLPIQYADYPLFDLVPAVSKE